jgi:hypothetical protein
MFHADTTHPDGEATSPEQEDGASRTLLSKESGESISIQIRNE